MVVEVPVEQRLLDHRQSEAIHRFEEGEVVQRVAGVAVDVEGVPRKGRSHRAQNFQVPAAPDLQLGALVAAIHRLLDFRQELIHAVLHAEVRSGVHAVPNGAEQPAERYAEGAGVQVPPGGLGSGSGERVPFERLEDAEQIHRRIELPSDQQRTEDLLVEYEDGGGRLRGVGGCEERRGLAPALSLPRDHPEEDGVDAGVFPVGRAPGVEEGERDVVDLDPVDPHAGVPAVSSMQPDGFPSLPRGSCRRPARDQ